MSRPRKIDPEIAEDLKRTFPRGSTVFLVLRHRAPSGMSRVIGVVGLGKDLSDTHPNYSVAHVVGLRVHPKYDGVVVSGAGMDMGFHLVSSLAYVLYGDQRALKYRWL